MSYELTGKIKLIQDEQIFSGGFRKRGVVVLVMDGQYTQEILLELHNDNIGLLDSLEPGQQIEASFNIRGRESKGRYFNNLIAWKIARKEVVADKNETVTPASPTGVHESAKAFDFEDEIPF